MSNLRLIRFVTARQTQLRGLFDVLFAVRFAAIVTLLPYLAGHSGHALEAVESVIAMALWTVVLSMDIAATRALVAWYDRTVGRVGQPMRYGFTGTGPILVALGIGLDLTSWFPANGYSAFPLILAAYGAWIAVRDCPWRAYYAGMLTLPALAPAVRNGADMLGHAPAYVTGVTALAIAALLDHFLLVHSIRRLRRAAATPEPENPRT